MNNERINFLIAMILEMRQDMLNNPNNITRDSNIALIAAYDALLHQLTERKVA